MIFKKNKKISLAYNQKKIINAVGIKVLDKELSVEDANKYLVEKLGIQGVQFSETGKIFVKIDEQNSEFLTCRSVLTENSQENYEDIRKR